MFTVHTYYIIIHTEEQTSIQNEHGDAIL